MPAMNVTLLVISEKLLTEHALLIAEFVWMSGMHYCCYVIV